MPATAMPVKHHDARACVHASMSMPDVATQTEAMMHAHHKMSNAPQQMTAHYTHVCEKDCQCLASLCHVVQFFYTHELSISPHLISTISPIFTGLRFPAKLIAQIERPPKL